MSQETDIAREVAAFLGDVSSAEYKSRIDSIIVRLDGLTPVVQIGVLTYILGRIIAERSASLGDAGQSARARSSLLKVTTQMISAFVENADRDPSKT